MQVFAHFFCHLRSCSVIIKSLSRADSACYSSKNAVPPARAFADPNRKRTFLSEYMLIYANARLFNNRKAA